VSVYVLYLFGTFAPETRAVELDCPDDETAIREAQRYAGRQGMELWDGARMVRHFPGAAQMQPARPAIRLGIA
jgi:hypothetical protein